MNKLILIDGSNLLHRALRVPQIFDLTYDGIRTGGVHVFFKSLISVYEGFKDYPLVFWDRGHSNRRVNLFPNYKKRETRRQDREAGLVPKEDLEYLDEYRKQRAIIQKILNFLAIPSLLLSATEADDMIAYVATNYSDQVSFIMSEDMDFLQLVDRVDLYRPVRNKYYSEKEFSMESLNQARLNGLELIKLQDLDYDSVEHYLITKALMGDKSDNIQGVKSIGEKNGNKIAKIIIKDGLDTYLDYINENRDIKKMKISAKEKALADNVGDYKLALDLIDLSKEIMTDTQIKEIKDGIILALSATPDYLELTSLLATYGLMQLIGGTQRYIKMLSVIKDEVSNLFRDG